MQFSDSCLDHRNAAPSTTQVTDAFTCKTCDAKFASNKAMLCLMRAKHGLRYIDGFGTCPICMKRFWKRLRFVDHVMDPRCPSCAKALRDSQVEPIPPDKLAALEATDGAVLRNARRAGHSHAVAECGARRTYGKFFQTCL